MCRPPGNRDPQADEIESCEPLLFRQIELIEPKVSATLGNFATKLLSGRPLGITRVQGQEQELTIAGRSVVHPAAALYTPAMLEVLEADFARLPGLLGKAEKPVLVATAEAVLAAPAEQLGLLCSRSRLGTPLAATLDTGIRGHVSLAREPAPAGDRHLPIHGHRGFDRAPQTAR
jgi:Uracil DNA glycosylase superfamily